VQSSDNKKFGAAILGILIFLLCVRLVFVAVYEPRNLSRPRYILEGLVTAHPPGAAPLAAETAPDWNSVLPAADIAAGKKLSSRCVGCHDLSANGTNKFAPSLYGIVGRPMGAQPGYDYSKALSSRGGTWTPGDLFAFLREPQVYLPGTKMSAAGIESAQDRINLIAYLSHDPLGDR
jgi:cytochrome c